MIRGAKEKDIAFIYATFLNCLKEDSVIGKTTRRSTFFSNYSRILDNILLNSKCLMNCVKETPDVILGFLIYQSPNIVHFAFTKEAFRHLGVQHELFIEARLEGPLIATHKTSINFIDATFNPFLLYKGITNENS